MTEEIISLSQLKRFMSLDPAKLLKVLSDFRAERDAAREEVEKLKAIPHSCYENCSVPDCVNTRLHAQLAEAEDLLIRCNERLEDSDDADDLYCSVNAYLSKAGKQKVGGVL